MKKTKKKSVAKKIVTVSKKAKSSIIPTAISAGLAVAAAGTYFLYGSRHATRNRRLVKAWSLKARGEILEQLTKLPEIDERTYHKVIKEVAGKYKALENINAKDVKEFTGELQDHWKDIAKDIAKSAPVIKKISFAKKK